jgi:hypothetical protein
MYSVIQQINGTFSVKFEGDNLDGLKYNYHNWCAALWNDTGAVDGVVKIVDSNLDTVDGYVEFISHPAKN